MITAMRVGNRFRGLGLPLAVCLLLSACSAATRNSETVPLITEEEAALPPAPAERERGSCGPPEIRIDSPREGVTYQQPVPVTIRFAPSVNARIDPASVRIELLKFKREIDLTGRVREHIKAAGIEVPGADIPRGTHRVRITVADSSGKSCFEVVEFKVTR